MSDCLKHDFRTFARVQLANKGRLLLRTPGPVLFGTCICSNVETIFSRTCHVYGPFEFRTSLGTFILLADSSTVSGTSQTINKSDLHKWKLQVVSIINTR